MAVTSSGTINYEAFCAAPDCGAYRNIFVFCLNTELEAHIETFCACNKTETVEKKLWTSGFQILEHVNPFLT